MSTFQDFIDGAKNGDDIEALFNRMLYSDPYAHAAFDIVSRDLGVLPHQRIMYVALILSERCSLLGKKIYEMVAKISPPPAQADTSEIEAKPSLPFRSEPSHVPHRHSLDSGGADGHSSLPGQ